MALHVRPELTRQETAPGCEALGNMQNMTHNYFIDKQKHLKTLKTSTMFGLGSLIILILINILTFRIIGFIFISLLLGGAVLIWLISLWRTIFLLRLPLIQINDDSIKYFNILWYNRHKWDKFEIACFDPETNSISIGLANGKLFDKLLLESFSEETIENIKKQLVEKGKLRR